MAMLRPEPEMKDSGIECIGKIPKDWTMRKIKYGFSIISGATPKSDVLEFWDGDIIWVTPADYKTDEVYVECGRKSLTQLGYDSCGTTIVPIGSLIFSKRAPIGTVAINKVPLCTNQGCLSCVPNSSVLSKYYYYVMSVFTELFEIYGSGTLFKEISAQSFANIELPCPDLKEQQAIASYLDDRCSKLDEIITEAEKSIEEYKELKQAVIFEAVTKGLDKNIPMKDSGIEWICEIPSTWNVTRIKYLLCEINNRSETGEEEPLSVSQVLGVVPSTMIAVANPASSTIGQKIVESGDLVFNKLKAHLGVFFVSDYKGLVSPDYAVYRANDKVNPNFLEYLFHTPACITEFKKYITGVAVGLMRLYTSDLFNISIALPKRSEQERIIEYLADNVSKYDALISEKQSLIEDLKAYKKSLIYEVVTGKRRVV